MLRPEPLPPVPDTVTANFPEIVFTGLEGMARRGSSKGLDRTESVEGRWGSKALPSPARGASGQMGAPRGRRAAGCGAPAAALGVAVFGAPGALAAGAR